MHIFLIRHGESYANTGENDEIRIPDHLVRLTDKGHEQARVNGEFLANYCREKGIDLSHARIWRSPFLRTRETSEEFNKALKITDIREDITLTEQQYGLFDCLPLEEKLNRYPDECAEYKRQLDHYGRFYARPPLGESPFDVAPQEIHKIRTLATYLGGRCVYKC